MSGRIAAVAVVLAAVVAGAAGYAVAQTEEPDTVSACVWPDGSIRAASSRAGDTPNCRGNESSITWHAGPPPGARTGFGEFYSAVTFKPDPSDCPEGEYRAAVAQHWGQPLPWVQSDCYAPTSRPGQARLLREPGPSLNARSLPQLDRVMIRVVS